MGKAEFDYQKYLASRKWAKKREAVKERSGNICERCGERPHEATHHLTYKNIGNEPLEDLQGVCNPCHLFLSGKSDDDPKALVTTKGGSDTKIVYIYDLQFALTWVGTFNEAPLSNLGILKLALEEAARKYNGDSSKPLEWLGELKCGVLPAVGGPTLWIARELENSIFGSSVLLATTYKLPHISDDPEFIITIGRSESGLSTESIEAIEFTTGIDDA